MIKIFAMAAAAAAVALEGCNQSAQQAEVVAAAPVVATGPAPAQGGNDMLALAPI